MGAEDQSSGPDQRRESRVSAGLRVSTTTMDPVRDVVTHEICYQISEDDTTLNLSRRGVRLRCERPPEIGTRLLLQIQPQGEETPIEVIGRTCWTRVEYQPGSGGARPYAAVGVELVGGSRRALTRYGRCLARLRDSAPDSVAPSAASG
jgi:hypothetical protein